MKSGQNWYKNGVTWVVIIAIFSACALLVIQGIWLKRTFEDESQRLNKDLNRILPEFLFYRPDLSLLKFISPVDSLSKTDELRVLERQIEHTLTTSLEMNDIRVDFAYALLNNTRDSILLSSAAEYNEALLTSEYQRCINCREMRYLPLDSLGDGDKRYDYLISIAPDDEKYSSSEMDTEHVYVSLYFPGFDQVILNNILSQLVLVLIFVILIVGCFFYILRIVFRQKKVSEIKDDFINSLTHEFKTPLASMSLATTVVRESLAEHLSDRDRHHFDLIRNEQNSLENQIDKVLQMAMADAGNFELEFEKVDLYQLIQETLASFELLVQRKKGSITLKPSSGQFFVNADMIHMANVLYNLIDNALKYCNEAPIIAIELSTTKHHLMVAVKDNGVGIAPEMQRVIFDKFYRVHNEITPNSEGFGLGLSYVKRIVNLHGGEVRLESTPDHGSMFIVSLPIE